MREEDSGRSEIRRPSGGREGWILLALVGMAALLLSSGSTARRGGVAPAKENAASPRSVILFIADGMGPQQIGLHLDVQDALGRHSALERAFDVSRTSTVRTGSASSPVTDSAASATAMASGVDTSNGMVGVDPDGKALRSCLEDARDSGRATALVTSTRLTHATPASFAAHVPDRDLENAIARGMLSQEIDILLGGGAIHFLGGLGGQNLASEINAGGYRLVRTADELAAAPVEGKLLGLFHGDNLPYVVDRDGGEGEPTRIPTLRTMTAAALERLESAPGYFLMIEAGRIDHAGHANDAGTLLGEMQEFDDTLGLLLDHIATHPDVSLIVTADHETGGLCFTSRPTAYPGTDDLRALAATEGSAKVRLLEGVEDADAARASAVLGTARAPFVAEVAWPWNLPAIERSAQHFVSFGSGGHSATPITLFHAGAGEPFPSLMRHTDLGRRLRAWMSVPVPGEED